MLLAKTTGVLTGHHASFSTEAVTNWCCHFRQTFYTPSNLKEDYPGTSLSRFHVLRIGMMCKNTFPGQEFTSGLMNGQNVIVLLPELPDSPTLLDHCLPSL